jgi:hypothetical protein
LEFLVLQHLLSTKIPSGIFWATWLSLRFFFRQLFPFFRGQTFPSPPGLQATPARAARFFTFTVRSIAERGAVSKFKSVAQVAQPRDPTNS